MGSDVGGEVLGRLDLRCYWNEIRQLPPAQCVALLLQAHDPDGNFLIELLEMQGTASLREMATAINLTPHELAALWNDIPLNDARIAERLGCTAQRVARLRMMGRRRVMERMRETV